MNYDNIPRIHIELQGIQQQLVHAFHGHCDEIKQLTEVAIKEALDPARIKETARNTARDLVDRAVRDAVTNWFYTEGNAVIKAHVADELEARREDYMP